MVKFLHRKGRVRHKVTASLLFAAEFVVAAARLRGRHGFALRNIDGVHSFALRIDYLVGAAAGSVVTAVQSHKNTSLKGMGGVPHSLCKQYVPR